MELDESGFPQPTGRFETLAADTVILALGQETDTAFLRTGAGGGVRARRHRAACRASMMTGCPGVFAGGDMVPSERTVTVGVGHGKRAAREIDAWLRGASWSARRSTRWLRSRCCNLWYFGDAARRQQPELEPRRASRRLRGGGRRTLAAAGDVRGAQVPVVRELLRVRWLPRRVPRGRGDQARVQGYRYRVRL